jgi:hypothetical protein
MNSIIMSFVPVESVKKKMEKKLHMIPREEQDLQDVLDRTNAIAEGLKKNVSELQSRVQMVSFISLLSMKLTNGRLFEYTNTSVS